MDQQVSSPQPTDLGQAVIGPEEMIRAVDVRVLHVVNGEHFSGAERVQSHLGRCLPRYGVAADFVCIKPGKFAKLLQDKDGLWGRGFEAAMNSRIDFSPALRVRDLVRDHGYHLLHAHTPRTAMITSVASTLTGVPWVYHVHSPASRDSDNRVSNRVNAWVERRSMSGAAHLIAVSESLRLEYIAKGTPEEKVTVIHNGVPAIRPMRESMPVPGARWTIGMVALMRPRKGLEVVLHAISQLEKSGHDVALRCIGAFETEEYEADIEALIGELNLHDRVQRDGFTDDVPRVLARLDALVLPSLFGEGLPMVVLEAMAAALPVIATRVEGTPEAITHGVEGLLAEPRDAASLADAIRQLITGRHNWREIAEAACRRHGRCFSDLAMASGTADVYRRVLENKAEAAKKQQEIESVVGS
jgi:glycosyltransferase involved in cell wall biosynthesis